MRIGVIGLGKLGLPLVAVLVESGCEVVGVDSDVELVAELRSGRVSLQEPGAREALHGRSWTASSDYASLCGAEIVFVVTPTPSKPDGSFSLKYVQAAVENVKLDRDALLVITSTVMPGHMRQLKADCDLCYNPQFIALGTVMRDMKEPDLILIGADREEDAGRLIAFYRGTLAVRAPIRVLDYLGAEIAKLALNCYLTVKISYANFLGQLCGELGTDAGQVAATIGMDRRIGGAYLRPAVAYGGPCLPRDSAALACTSREAGVDPGLTDAAYAINRRHTAYLAEQVLGAEKVAILGLAYKPDTPVHEDSAGVALAQALKMEVVGHDPMAQPEGIALMDVDEAVAWADTVVVTTPWPEYRALDVRGKRVIDPWGLYD